MNYMSYYGSTRKYRQINKWFTRSANVMQAYDFHFVTVTSGQYINKILSRNQSYCETKLTLTRKIFETYSYLQVYYEKLIKTEQYSPPYIHKKLRSFNKTTHFK